MLCNIFSLLFNERSSRNEERNFFLWMQLQKVIDQPRRNQSFTTTSVQVHDCVLALGMVEAFLLVGVELQSHVGWRMRISLDEDAASVEVEAKSRAANLRVHENLSHVMLEFFKGREEVPVRRGSLSSLSLSTGFPIRASWHRNHSPFHSSGTGLLHRNNQFDGMVGKR